jgi:hypothetical protein
VFVALVVGFRAARAGECIPDLTYYTATPTIAWSQADHTNTAGFRVYWKRADDVLWRGSIDLPAWKGDANSTAVWPGITESWPIQRLIPVSEVRLLVDIRVVPYSASNVEGPAGPMVRLCMPEIWTGGRYR